MKELRITSSKIEVSANQYSPTGYYASHKVRGILPGCRKESDLTFTPMSGYIWVKNLWSYSGSASIEPTAWAELVKSSPVVSNKLESFAYPLTPEVVADAIAHALSITTSPAVTSREHVHPNYQPTLDEMTYTVLSVEQELAKMSNRELVAYWNIIQMGKRMVGGGGNSHEPIVDSLMTSRGIKHEANKRTVLVAKKEAAHA